MHTRFVAALAVALAFVAVDAHAQYVKVNDIKIGGSGAFDYLTVDSAGKRLYVTHGTEVVVIDTATDTIVGRITNTPRVHGVAIGPGGRGFTSNGGENKVSIIDLRTLQTISKVDTGLNPDAILYEPGNKEIYSLNHTGKSATVIDPATGKVNATIPLSGQAESGQADPQLGRVFVNIQDKNAIDVIDTKTHAVIATWPTAPAESPTGMAIDATAHRLFVGGGPAMVMVDATSGKVVANAPICRGTDATFFDAALHTVFASCGDGHITVMKADGDRLTVTETIDTARGARTMAIDPATHKLYTATQDFETPADPNARPTAVPDSFHLLVFAIK
jgi:YVTN family beta-propeller protein